MAQNSRSIGFTFYAKDMFDRVGRRMVESIQKVKVGLATTATTSRDVTREMERMARSLSATDAAARRSSRSAANVERAWGRLGRGFAATAAGVFSVATAKHMLSQAATVEDAVNKVMSLVSDTSDQTAYAAKVEAIIRENQRLGISAASLGDVLSEQVSAMGLGAESLDAFRASVRLSVAAFQPLESSVASVNKLLENYPELKARPDAAAQLLFTARQKTTDFAGLAASLPSITPLAATAGVSPERMLALFTVLADETKSATAAASVEADLLRTLGTRGTPKQRALLDQMSIDATPAGLAKAGLDVQLARLRRVAQANPAAASAVGLSEATQKALLTMSDEDIQKIARVEGAIRADAGRGTIDASFARVQASTTAEAAKTREALNELSSILGAEIAPPLRRLAESLREANLPRPNLDADLGLRPGASAAEVWAAIRRANSQPSGAGGLDPGARPGR